MQNLFQFKASTAFQPSVRKEPDSCSLDDSLTNIQWLGKILTCNLEPEVSRQPILKKENQIQMPRTPQPWTRALDQHRFRAAMQETMERPPYTYSAIIQCGINSRMNKRMTLKDLYKWIPENFPYYRDVAKPGWKNSIRHNLSLHDMFIREGSQDGFYWTIRPEANRGLTIDKLDQQHWRKALERKKAPISEMRTTPLLPQIDSNLATIQLPIGSSVYLPGSSFISTCFQQEQNPFGSTVSGTKWVRIAPKMPHTTFITAETPQINKKIKIEVRVPVSCKTSNTPSKVQPGSSQCNQCPIPSVQNKPILLCPDNTFFDSGMVSDTSIQQCHQNVQPCADQGFLFKNSMINHLTSTPSKQLPDSDLWKLNLSGIDNQMVLKLSPIHNTDEAAVTPEHSYSFKELPLFGSPTELLSTAPALPAALGASSVGQTNITEELVLDTTNDSLKRFLGDASFTGLNGENLDTADISWSDFMRQFHCLSE